MRHATIATVEGFRGLMIDEQSLAAHLAADLDGHFEHLVRTYQDRLYSFALRTTGSRQDAEESTQDAFVRAYRALRSYPEDRRRAMRLRPWLYQITLNTVRNGCGGRCSSRLPSKARWAMGSPPAQMNNPSE